MLRLLKYSLLLLSLFIVSTQGSPVEEEVCCGDSSITTVVNSINGDPFYINGKLSFKVIETNVIRENMDQ